MLCACSGYLSPEYAIDGKFSMKSDIFSFGVILLEIISGRKNRGFHHPDHDHSLLGHVRILCLCVSLCLLILNLQYVFHVYD